jgi:serine/threonine-protein kinase
MLRAGERVGDWIIDAPLGEGGMGAVYRVHSALTERLVAALKVMKPTAEPDARARFVREAEALSALRHPAVVRVMGFSEDPDRDLLYIVMELAVGETLRARVARGPMELSEALATFAPLAQGLDHAHAAGIFHRDLKPSNVILTVDGTPRLVDFGIAAALNAEPLTTSGQLGTLPYLPPEVFRGERAEPAAIDVYAFGLLLHEALTGHRSFAVDPSSTPAAMAAAIGLRKLQTPSVELPGHFPERLRQAVRRATDPDPKARPTMRELRQALESVVERRAAGAGSARLVPTGAATLPEEATTRVPDPPSVPYATNLGDELGVTGSRAGRRRSDRTRARLLTAAAVAAALLALALILLARGPGSERVAAGASQSARPPRVTPAPHPPRLSPATVPAPQNSPSPTPSLSPGIPPGDRAAATEAQRVPADAPVAGAREGRSEPPPGSDPDPPVERIDEPGEATAAAGHEPVHVGGRWELTHDVESTSYQPFEGMRLGYRINLVQEGSRVYGQGQKVSENGVALPPGQRTPIDVAGRIQNGQLVLYYTEIGRSRTSRGTIRWHLAPGAQLRGRFASDAANSSGTSSGRRLP